MKWKALAVLGTALLVGCGGDEAVQLDKARFALVTTLSDKAATNVTLGGDADNYVSATLLDSAIGTGKVFSERRSKANVSSVTVDWGGVHYVESLKHDTWSRVEMTQNGADLVVSVAGRFVSPSKDQYIDVDWSTVTVAPSDFK